MRHAFNRPGTTATAAAQRVRSLRRHLPPAPHGISLREIEGLNEQVQRHQAWVGPLRRTMASQLVGRKHLADRLLVSLVARGHVLLEGGPGMARTKSLRTLAAATGMSFQPLNLTPDLAPTDLLASALTPGPVFANLVLACGVDQAPPRVQAALLEVMESGGLGVLEGERDAPDLFLVMATQDPLQRAAAHPLPQGRLDRFLVKVALDTPTAAQEREIIDVADAQRGVEVSPVVDEDRLLEAQLVAQRVYVDDRIKDYIVTLIDATRDPAHYGLDLGPFLRHGASSRATLDLVAASRAVAMLRGRAFVTAGDVQAIWPDVIRHRLGLSGRAVVEGVRALQVATAIRDGIAAP